MSGSTLTTSQERRLARKGRTGIEASKRWSCALAGARRLSDRGEEIRHAIEHNKRLIPILRTDFEPEHLYPELNAPNWPWLGPG